MHQFHIKVTRGHSGPELDDDAKAVPLPDRWVDVVIHLGYLAYAGSVAKYGLTPGGLAGISSRNCCHFSAGEYDAEEYAEAQAQGDLVLPSRVGYPPRHDADAKCIFNFAASQ